MTLIHPSYSAAGQEPNKAPIKLILKSINFGCFFCHFTSLPQSSAVCDLSLRKASQKHKERCISPAWSLQALGVSYWCRDLETTARRLRGARQTSKLLVISLMLPWGLCHGDRICQKIGQIITEVLRLKGGRLVQPLFPKQGQLEEVDMAMSSQVFNISKGGGSAPGQSRTKKTIPTCC